MKETLKESNRLDDLEIEEMSNDWETMSQQSTTTKQTSVDWLVEKIQQANPTFKFDALIRKAKAMEKEQIIDAAKHGANFENSPFINAEQYYKETYKQNKNK